jgi:hypothetical protein
MNAAKIRKRPSRLQWLIDEERQLKEHMDCCLTNTSIVVCVGAELL